jgi:hypothetical protein
VLLAEEAARRTERQRFSSWVAVSGLDRPWCRSFAALTRQAAVITNTLHDARSMNGAAANPVPLQFANEPRQSSERPADANTILQPAGKKCGRHEVPWMIIEACESIERG